MLLWCHNPDMMTSFTSYFIEYGTPYVDIRGDGYLGRPALTSNGADGYVIQFARWPPIHPVGNLFRFGGRFRIEQAPAAPHFLLAAVDGSGGVQVGLALEPDLSLSIYRGNYTAQLKTSFQTLQLGTTYRLGFKGRVHNSIGEAQGYINRTSVIGVTGNTSSFAETGLMQWDGGMWGLVDNSAVNHLYMMDSFGFMHDLIPDLIVHYRKVTATATQSGWTPNAGTMVSVLDDVHPDDDTTYAEGVANGVYTMQMEAADLTHEPIIAVQTSALVRSVDGDPHLHRLVLQRGSTFYDDDVHFIHGRKDWVLQDTYTLLRRMDYAQPHDGLGWVYQRLNDYRFGGRVV